MGGENDGRPLKRLEEMEAEALSRLAHATSPKRIWYWRGYLAGIRDRIAVEAGELAADALPESARSAFGDSE